MAGMENVPGERGFEDHRKLARYLENEIDTKLVSLSKMGANAALVHAESDSDTSPLISSDRIVDSLQDEIDALLRQLSKINDEMNNIATSTPGMATPALIHTLQRHRDILQDYSQEFRKTQKNLKSRREREELLHGGKEGTDSNRNSTNRRMDMYMKEHDHLVSSEKMVDEQIRIAIDTKENLVNQRVAFKKIQHRVNDIASRFPRINNLIQKINLKKRKDSVILGIVVGVCTFLMIMYAFR